MAIPRWMYIAGMLVVVGFFPYNVITFEARSAHSYDLQSNNQTSAYA